MEDKEISADRLIVRMIIEGEGIQGWQATPMAKVRWLSMMAPYWLSEIERLEKELQELRDSMTEHVPGRDDG